MRLFITISLVLFSFVIFVDTQCNETLQTMDTFKLCQIFKDTNMENAYPNWKLNMINYCDLQEKGPPMIVCNNDNIVLLQLLDDFVDNNRPSGVLQTQYEWPELRYLEFESHTFTYSSKFNFTGLLNPNLEVLWLERWGDANVPNSGPITGLSIFYDIFLNIYCIYKSAQEWLEMASLPRIQQIRIIREGFTGNPGVITQWNTPSLHTLRVGLYFLK